MKLTDSVIRNFLSKFDSSNPEKCWVWQAYKNDFGYGVFQKYRQGSMLAHRLSYELFTGPIPTGVVVRHRCDNPSCVNPRHLELGTYRDNAIDQVKRGRHRWGPNPPNRITTKQLIKRIFTPLDEEKSPATIHRTGSFCLPILP